MLKNLRTEFLKLFTTVGHIAPLVVLRILFGSVMFFSTIRFILKGWVTDFYILPSFHFTFCGFSWVKPLGETGMYVVFACMALAAFCMAAGLFYRFFSSVFFLSFTYVELIDKTYYLNHYYFVTLLAFLMILVPANRYFSLDVLRKPALKVTYVPMWTISIFKLQLFIVYFLAGVSKLNADWLLNAMPLTIWLPANAHLPVIGSLLQQHWVAYAFSWFGAIFDLFIVFFLLNKSTRPVAYAVVILFHIFTAWFFKIGMFPFIMMTSTVIFFSENFHIQFINRLRNFFGKSVSSEQELFLNPNLFREKTVYTILIIYFILQSLVPFRFLLYPGKLLWTEEGYRFSWRVMLMEKSGTAFFYVTDPLTGNSSEIINSHYLTRLQEKMMATQPDMILQYAHHLAGEFKKRGIKDPVITVESYVNLNGSGSRPFVNNTTDLAKEHESLAAKKWILPYSNN